MREHVVMQNGVTLIVLLIILFIFLTPLALRLELLEEINYQRVGLTQGLPIFRVKNRRQAGLLEDRLRQHIADRTQWQRMLKGNNESLDLPTIRDELVETCRIEIAKLAQEYGLGGMQFLDKLDPVEIGFPVSQFPEKLKSLNLDKQPLIEGVLQGIKGQYLILDSGVINIRKYTAYNVEFSVQGSLTV